jgi:hypothetical protein
LAAATVNGADGVRAVSDVVSTLIVFWPTSIVLVMPFSASFTVAPAATVLPENSETLDVAAARRAVADGPRCRPVTVPPAYPRKLVLAREDDVDAAVGLVGKAAARRELERGEVARARARRGWDGVVLSSVTSVNVPRRFSANWAFDRVHVRGGGDAQRVGAVARVVDVR